MNRPSIRQRFHRCRGVATEAGRARRRQRSPVDIADRVVLPFRLEEGADHPRVDVRVPGRRVDVSVGRRALVVGALSPDEAHGFAPAVNGVASRSVDGTSLAPRLGRHAEPIGDALEVSP